MSGKESGDHRKKRILLPALNKEMSIRRITFAFPAVISYNKATCGAFEKLRSDLGYIKNIQIEVRFHGPNSLLGTLQNLWSSYFCARNCAY